MRGSPTNIRETPPQCGMSGNFRAQRATNPSSPCRLKVALAALVSIITPRAFRFMPSIARHLSRPLPILLIVVCWGWYASPAAASVVILANRTKQKTDFTLVWSAEKKSKHDLEPGDQVPIAVNKAIQVEFLSGEVRSTATLQPNTIHFFVKSNDKSVLAKVRFPDPPGNLIAPQPTKVGVELKPVAKIPVMILVDDDEPTVRRLWEARLRKRMEAASDIFEQHCRVRFEVVAVGTWSSDNTILNFNKSLREFELEVNPAPAVLAVGFTSQYRIPSDRTMHLGGTRGPLHPYILIREWSQHITTTERLEILVHELGHYFGCVHTSDKHSVMRPKLGDRRSHAKDFRIGFDPANAMAMYLLGEEFRERPLRRFCYMRPPAKANLHSLYLGLEKTIKDDDSAERYIQMLSIPTGTPVDIPELDRRLIQGTKKVVAAVAEAANENCNLPPRPPGTEDSTDTDGNGQTSPKYRLVGDQLTDFYVRKAASAASALPEKFAQEAFLASLAVVLDRSHKSRFSPITREICAKVESNDERRTRLRNMGMPTIHGQQLLLQRFSFACGVAAICSPTTAEMNGINFEINVSRFRGKEFNFNHIAADMAGIGFYMYVEKADNSLARVANAFKAEAFLPKPEQPEDKVTWDEFLEQYGSAHDERFHAKKAAIRGKVLSMPPFKPR